MDSRALLERGAALPTVSYPIPPFVKIMIASSLVILSVLASALALPAVDAPNGAVPIFKRTSVKRADGTVNQDLVRKQLARSLR